MMFEKKSWKFIVGFSRSTRPHIWFSIIFNGEFGVIECFHVTSRRPYLNSGAAAMLVYLILRELSSIVMQTFSFVSVDKQGYWSHECKHSGPVI